MPQQDIITATDNKILKEGQQLWNKVKECAYEEKYRKLLWSDLKYFTGEDQGWSDGSARADLEEKGLPALTLNRIAPIIRLIVGAAPDTEAKYSAVEEGDVETSSILNACKDHVENINQWEFTAKDWRKNMLVLNRSVIELAPDYNQDVRGDVELLLHPGDEFYFDPDSKRKDRRDMNYMFRCVEVSPKECKRSWPKSISYIDQLVGYTKGDESGTPSRDSGEPDEYTDPRSNYYDPASDKIKIVYYWYKDIKNVTKIVDLMLPDETGKPKVYDSKKTVEQVKETLKTIGGDAEARFKVVSVKITDVKYMIFTHDIVLEEGDNPWNRPDGKPTILSKNFPFVCAEPDRLITGTRQELISLIDPLKDPQKFHNKLASAIIHIIGTTASSGWDYETGAANKTWLKKLREQGSKAGFIMEWAKGAISGGRFQKRQPSMPPQAQMAEAKAMGDELLDISGVESLVSTESLGKGASGKAIDLKQRQGGNIISWVYDSFRFYQHILAEYIRDAMQMIYDYEKVVRIKGVSGLKPQQEYIRINEAIPDDMGNIIQVLNDVTIGTYDVAISDREMMPSLRIERFRIFADLVKSGALVLPPEVMTKVVISLMDDADLKKIIETELGEWAAMAQQQPQLAAAGGAV